MKNLLAAIAALSFVLAASLAHAQETVCTKGKTTFETDSQGRLVVKTHQVCTTK
jgi:hypothetical protein